MAVDVLLGLQWGDEGKGKIVDYLAPDYDLICRFQGGPNAGHTIVIGDQRMVLHTIPSGIFRPDCENIIGSGVVIDPITLCREIDHLAEAGLTQLDHLKIARKAHLILPTHRMLDAASEAAKGKDKIGSTLKGIGPTYMDKTGRNGLRIGEMDSKDFRQKYLDLKEKHLGLLQIYPEIDFDLKGEEEKWFKALERLKKFTLIDCAYYINDNIHKGRKILAEGAQGALLDIDFGTYPYVTSSNTTTAGVCTGLGIAPHHIGKVIGISKAYCTRVGSGPFPTELHDETGRRLQEKGSEFGATTGRPRRCGWIDIPQLKYSLMINGVTDLVITKIDVLDGMETLCTGDQYVFQGQPSDRIPYNISDGDLRIDYQEHPGWEDETFNLNDKSKLPEALLSYLDNLEKKLGQKVKYLSTGPDREALIEMQ